MDKSLSPFYQRDLTKDIKLPEKEIFSDSSLVLRVFDIPDVSHDFKEKMLKGIISTYENAPYLDEAFSMFDSLIIMRPDRPEGYFMKASLLLSIYQVEKKQEIFDSLKVYAERTIQISEDLLELEPENQYYHFYLGAIYGNMGLEYLRKKSYWSAYRNGSKGKGYLEKALKIDPEFADAELGIGVFEYYADVLPKYLKPLLFIVRMSGNRKEGLKKIRRAAVKSDLSKIEANYFYAKIINEYEGDPETAKEVYQKLHVRFPNNMYYQYSLAVFLYENGELKRARDLFDRMTSRPHRYYNRNVGFYSGIIRHMQGDYSESTFRLRNVTGLNAKSSKDLLCELNYFIGLNFEYQGDRTKALPYYKKAAQTGSKLHKDELNGLLKRGLGDEDLRIRGIDNLMNRGKNEEAETQIYENLRLMQENGAVSQMFDSKYQLQLAEIHLKQKNIREVRFYLDNYSEKQYSDSDVFRTRYHILGIMYDMETINVESAHERLKMLKKIDLKKLPVYYRRTFNKLQRNVIGRVKH